MLVIFKSKAAGQIIMYEENARPILELLGKEVKQGIITADETVSAIAKLEAEVVRQKALEAKKEAQREAEAMAKDVWEEDEEKIDARIKSAAHVSFAARVYPFLEMLHAANKKEREIVWGV